jgi:integrase
MSRVVERVRYGKRCDGALVKFDDSPRWISCLYVAGVEHRESTRTTDLKAARRFHKQKLDEAALDRQGVQSYQAPVAKRLTVGEILNALEADYALRKIKSLKSARSHLKLVRAHLGEMRVHAMSAETIDAFVEKLRELEFADATINRATQVLRQAMKLAQERGKLQSIPKVRRLPERNVRKGFFEKPVLDALIEALPAHLKDIVLFAAMTGMRRGEIVGLEWSAVDMVGQTIRLWTGETKNDEGREISMDDVMLALMKRREAARLSERGVAALVFSNQGKRLPDFRTAWKKACQATGLAHFVVDEETGKKTLVIERTFHDLRRSAIRWLVRQGTPERVAMSMSGHKTRAVFDRYNISSTRDKQEAAERMGRFLQPESDPERTR